MESVKLTYVGFFLSAFHESVELWRVGGRFLTRPLPPLSRL